MKIARYIWDRSLLRKVFSGNYIAFQRGGSTATMLSTAVTLLEPLVTDWGLYLRNLFTNLLTYLKLPLRRSEKLWSRPIRKKLGQPYVVVPNVHEPKGETSFGAKVIYILWDLVFHNLLDKIKGQGWKVVGCVNDLLIIVRGHCLVTLMELLQSTLLAIDLLCVKMNILVNPKLTKFSLYETL